MASYQKQLKQKEEECKQLKTENTKLKEDLESKSTLSLQKALENKTYECKDLTEKLKEGEVKLEDYTQKHKLWTKRERELNLMIQTYQEIPKEKLDIAKLRISEKKALEENERLIKELEVAKKGEHLKELEEKYVKEIEALKTEKSELSRKLMKAKDKKKDLTKRFERQKKEAADLLEEIEIISKDYEKNQKQNSRLLELVSEKENSNTGLFSERVKLTQMQALLQKEKKMLEEKLSTLEKLLNEQKEVIEKTHQKGKILEETLTKATAELQIEQTKTNQSDTKASEAITLEKELQAKLVTLHNDYEEVKKKEAQARKSYEKEQHNVARITEERDKLNRKLARFMKNPDAKVKEHEEELELYRKLVNCSQCNVRQKDAIIAAGRCYHLFCMQCIQENISNRNRKCPACAKPFDKGNVRQIFWT